MFQRSDAENRNHVIRTADGFSQISRQFRFERHTELCRHDFRHFSGILKPFTINVHQCDFTLPQKSVQQNILDEILRKDDSAGTDHRNFSHSKILLGVAFSNYSTKLE